jgi:hypothetical protein
VGTKIRVSLLIGMHLSFLPRDKYYFYVTEPRDEELFPLPENEDRANLENVVHISNADKIPCQLFLMLL